MDTSTLLYKDSIHVRLIGIDATHEPGYTVDRAAGTGEYLFEFFDTAVDILDIDGRRRHEGGVFIVYSPGQRQYYRAHGPMRHTWFQLDGDGVAECMERYGIPVDRATPIGRPDYLNDLLDDIRGYLVHRHGHWQDAVTETCRALFRKLSRTLYQPAVVEPSPYERHVVAVLHRVRAQVFKDLKRRWTVEDMANLASMSAPRFAVAYSSHFGASPIDDLIDVRLRHAELLMRKLPMPVSDAARLSGFNSASNFHVRYRERTGRSPKKQRRPDAPLRPEIPGAETLTEYSEAARNVELLYVRPIAHWTFDEGDAEIVDNLRRHPVATVSGKVERLSGRRSGMAIHFDGDSYASIPEAVVDTSRSYTVSAWVAADRPNRMTAVSTGTSHHGAFYLQYIPLEGGFKFAVTVSDQDPTARFVVAQVDVEDGRWYHVTGVHDAAAQEIRLYVDGTLRAGRTFTTPWHADGVTYFGACRLLDTMIDQWIGAIDDVRFYDEALTAAEIGQIYRLDGRPVNV